MIRQEGERLLVSGPVTLGNVAAELESGAAAIRSGARSVDLSGVTELDSSLLAMLLAWMREARSVQRPLEFENLPEGLLTLARLYGVVELIPAGHPGH
jgi:phospholipid transport system transporter-binding protein